MKVNSSRSAESSTARPDTVGIRSHALSALFVENKTTAATETPGEASAARPARDALDHYDRAIERLKSGDWAGFGKEIDAMRGLLEAFRGQPGSH